MQQVDFLSRTTSRSRQQGHGGKPQGRHSGPHQLLTPGYIVYIKYTISSALFRFFKSSMYLTKFKARVPAMNLYRLAYYTRNIEKLLLITRWTTNLQPLDPQVPLHPLQEQLAFLIPEMNSLRLLSQHGHMPVNLSNPTDPTWSSYWRTRAARSKAAPWTCCWWWRRSTPRSGRSTWAGCMPSQVPCQVVGTLGLTAARGASLPLSEWRHLTRTLGPPGQPRSNAYSGIRSSFLKDGTMSIPQVWVQST